MFLLCTLKCYFIISPVRDIHLSEEVGLSVSINRAGSVDHGLVSGFLSDLAREKSWQLPADLDKWDLITAKMLNSDSWLFLLAREDERPCGLAVIEFRFTPFDIRQTANIVAVIVSSEQRRKGIGTALVKDALLRAERRGCSAVDIAIDPDDESTGFFRKLGFCEERSLLTVSIEADSD